MKMKFPAFHVLAMGIGPSVGTPHEEVRAIVSVLVSGLPRITLEVLVLSSQVICRGLVQADLFKE
jgi:hypothetical protein